MLKSIRKVLFLLLIGFIFIGVNDRVYADSKCGYSIKSSDFDFYKIECFFKDDGRAYCFPRTVGKDSDEVQVKVVGDKSAADWYKENKSCPAYIVYKKYLIGAEMFGYSSEDAAKKLLDNDKNKDAYGESINFDDSAAVSFLQNLYENPELKKNCNRHDNIFEAQTDGFGNPTYMCQSTSEQILKQILEWDKKIEQLMSAGYYKADDNNRNDEITLFSYNKYRNAAFDMLVTLKGKSDYENNKTNVSIQNAAKIYGEYVEEELNQSDPDSNDGRNNIGCNYIGQVSGSKLTINTSKTKSKKFDIVLPNSNKTIHDDDLSITTTFPTTSCEDLFYSKSANTFNVIDENSNYVSTTMKRICSKNSDIEQFCNNGKCKISNATCGSNEKAKDYGSCPSELRPAILFIKKAVMNTLQIFIPILLILLGTIDMSKAVMSNDEKGLHDSIGKFIRRIILAVAFFFITTIVNIVISRIAASTNVSGSESWKACWMDIK